MKGRERNKGKESEKENQGDHEEKRLNDEVTKWDIDNIDRESRSLIKFTSEFNIALYLLYVRSSVVSDDFYHSKFPYSENND